MMEFTRKELEDLKERLIDNLYNGMDSGDLEEFYKDAQREWVNNLPKDELIELFDDNGLLDEDDEEDD